MHQQRFDSSVSSGWQDFMDAVADRRATVQSVEASKRVGLWTIEQWLQERTGTFVQLRRAEQVRIAVHALREQLRGMRQLCKNRIQIIDAGKDQRLRIATQMGLD